MVTAALEIFLFYVSEMSFFILQMRDKSTKLRYIITILGVFLLENLRFWPGEADALGADRAVSRREGEPGTHDFTGRVIGSFSHQR
mgnify:CR=1 FL=1